jgi:hypothetical protein
MIISLAAAAHASSYIGCVWHGSACGCSSFSYDCVGEADSLVKSNQFYRNLWQNNFSSPCHMDKKVKYP